MYAQTSAELHVSAPAPLRAPSGAGIAGHQLSGALWSSREIVHYGPFGPLFTFRLASPELVWAQLAPRLSADDLVAVGDAIVGGRIPLGTIADLERIAGCCVGHRGARTIASAIGHLRVGSLSRPETLLRLLWVQLRASADDVFGDPNPFMGRLARRLRDRGWHPVRAELRAVVGARPAMSSGLSNAGGFMLR